MLHFAVRDVTLGLLYRGIICGDAGKSEDEPHGVVAFSGVVRNPHIAVGKKKLSTGELHHFSMIGREFTSLLASYMQDLQM